MLPLPQEVIDHVIDQSVLHDTTPNGRRTLENYSLVARSWLPRTSKHLLKKIEVDVLSVNAFIAFASTSERLATNVSELTINGTIDLPFDDLFHALPHLRSLELWSNLLEETQLFRQDAAFPPRHYLDRVRLLCTELVSIPYLLRTFARIETLELRSIEGEHNPGSDITVGKLPHFPLSIGRILFNDCMVHDVALFLGPFLRPSAIFVNGFDRPNLEYFALFVRNAGQELEHVNLLPTQDVESPSNRRFGRDTFNELDVLKDCPKLQSISVDLMDVNWDYDLCRGIFAHLPDSVRRVRITLDDDQLEDMLEAIAAQSALWRDESLGKLAALELRGLCFDEPPAVRAVALQELYDEVTANLPPRLRKIVSLMP